LNLIYYQRQPLPLSDLHKESFNHAGPESARDCICTAYQPLPAKLAIFGARARFRDILAMTFSPLAPSNRFAFIQSRISPISRPACFMTLGLATIALVASIATKLLITSMPNILPLVAAVVVVDVVLLFAPQNRIFDAVRTIMFGVLYLVITVLCGVVAAYSMQRLAFPLEDRFLTNADTALGLNWFGYAHWVDGHLGVQRVFHFAYDTISLQIAFPLVVLAFSNRLGDVRGYLLAFAIALTSTIIISALMPAAGPIVAVDRAAFHILHFTGATPLDHLMQLREAGPLIFTKVPGGIATFPSFHATVAVLTPLTLRRYPRILVVLLVLNAAMLGGTVTEGAHYFIDLVAGIGMAFFAYALAKRIIGIEDRSVYPLANFDLKTANAPSIGVLPQLDSAVEAIE
jgi:membrane-associated phospholipid phosphatase